MIGHYLSNNKEMCYIIEIQIFSLTKHTLSRVPHALLPSSGTSTAQPAGFSGQRRRRRGFPGECRSARAISMCAGDLFVVLTEWANVKERKKIKNI